MPKTLSLWIPFFTHICVNLLAGWPSSSFPYLQDFCRQEAIQGYCELVKKPCVKGRGSPTAHLYDRYCSEDKCLSKPCLVFTCSEVRVIHGCSEDLNSENQGLGHVAYPTFPLIFYFSPNAKFYSEASQYFSIGKNLFLIDQKKDSFLSFSILSSTLALPQFSLSRLLFNSLLH